MSRELAREAVNNALAYLSLPLLEVQKAPETTPLADFLADSLDSVEALMSLEDELRMEFSDEEAVRWTTLGDVVNFIMEKKYGQAAATAQSA